MTPDIARVIGPFPYRMAFAGGWIDQPFLSRLNPEPPGSLVTVAVEPTFRWMDRCGMATSTRNVALQHWGGRMPSGDPKDLVRELYEAENRGRAEPSGSQDMVGLLYPGVCRLDYDASVDRGIFPARIECCTDPGVARWLERVIKVLPIAQRPLGYEPLAVQHLHPQWIARLGESGRACWEAIMARSAPALGESMNECMRCWEALLPHVVRPPSSPVDLVGLARHYQDRSDGAMYSGCGGGYLYVVSEQPVPGSFSVQVRTGKDTA
ncbi:MAG TPA: hypothetical protein VL354_02015 [Spirochaetia bacterium]|nr:hypothetical protein [Spirochaetia bacterium]